LSIFKLNSDALNASDNNVIKTTIPTSLKGAKSNKTKDLADTLLTFSQIAFDRDVENINTLRRILGATNSNQDPLSGLRFHIDDNTTGSIITLGTDKVISIDAMHYYL
jgi:hypothetical protein